MLDPKNLLETFGVIGLFAIVFAETGLLIGFFLPGDSLLVLAGLVCAVGAQSNLDIHLNLGVVLVGLFVSAVNRYHSSNLALSVFAEPRPTRRQSRRPT